MRILAVLAVAAMLVICVQPAQAEGLSFYGGLGFAKWLEDDAPDGSLGITAGAMLPFAGAEGLMIGGEAGYLMLGSIKESDCGYGGCASAEASFSVIPLSGQLWYVVPTNGTVAPLITAGLGLYMFRADIDMSPDPWGISGSTTDTEFGLNIGGGIKFGDPDASMKFGADIRLHHVMTEGESTQLLTIMGRLFF